MQCAVTRVSLRSPGLRADDAPIGRRDTSIFSVITGPTRSVVTRDPAFFFIVPREKLDCRVKPGNDAERDSAP